MPGTLHLAPVGHDKTALAISLLNDVTRSARVSFPRVWVLTATRRQEFNFRGRLIESADSANAYFNVEFFNFYALNAQILRLAGTPVRRLNSQTRFGLLRDLLAQMRADCKLSFFHRIAEKRGFVSVLADLIDELKQGGIDVADFAAAVQSEKDREIAAVYRRYQEMLRKSELADVEGEGWLALATLRRRSAIAANVDLLLVDGYDQFTPVQAQLLAELARSIEHVHCTLTTPPVDIGDPAPGRSMLARKRLEDAFAAAKVKLTVRQVEAEDGAQQADLGQLAQNIFRDQPANGVGNAIRLIAMPNEAEEVRAVLRAVKAQLLDGARPDDMLIALRDWNRYATYFDSGQVEYDLPLLLHHERSFSGSPVIAALQDLLQLAPRFRRLELLDVLRSPYIDVDLDAGLIDLLDKISRERQFTGGGKAEWLEIIALARQRSRDPESELDYTVLTPDQAAQLTSRLSAFIGAVTPAESAGIRDYIRWLAGLLGSDPRAAADEREAPPYSLNVIMRAWEHDRANPAIVRRDIDALNGLRQILRDMLSCDDVMRATFGRSAGLGWDQFWSDLRHALETKADDAVSLSRNGRVLVTTATEARGLPHPHVYILGLAEGIFPAEASEDPLYLDSERTDFQARGIPLATQAERIDDQGLFYELISLPRQSLTLSRPTFQAGKVWIESHFWRAVTQVFPKLSIISRTVGAVIDAEDAANSTELMLALSDQLHQQDASEATAALRVGSWLRAQPAFAEQWQRILHGRRVELGRLSNAPFDRYSGILSQPAMLDQAAHSLGEKRSWSASRLKDYGLCGFRYFAKRLLKLEEVVEPEAGVDALQLGLLNHSILESTYRRIGALGLSISESNVEKALTILAQVAEDWLERAPDALNFRATATWQEEKQVIFNRLAALIKLDFSAESPLNRFGESRQVEQLEHAFSDLEIELPDGIGPIRVNGFIDRIDKVDGRLVLIDYKTGSTRINRREMEAGRDFQMMIYLLALRSLAEHGPIDGEVAGGMFWHLRDLKTSGVFDSENEEDLAALEVAGGHIANNLQMGRGGQFPVHPTALENGKCARYCEYSHFCRMQVTRRYKTLPPS